MTDVKDRAVTLLVERKFSELREMLCEMNSADIAGMLSDFPKGISPLLFRVLPKELAADTFVMMDSEIREELVNSFSDSELKEVFSEMFIDDTVDVIEEMPAALVKRIIKNTPKEKRNAINEILKYPENSAGSVMTVEYVTLRAEMTVKEAFVRIRRVGVDKETIYTCYVTDDKRKLLGIVTAKELMLSEWDEPIENLMDTNIISCQTSDKAEDVAHQIEKYDLLAIPVVDMENRIVGIVTFDDAMDVIKEETDDDFMKMAAVEPLDDSYFKTSVFTHARKRIVWLLILMLSATFTGIIITKFEDAMTALLVSFIPMLMDTGGNSGSQSTAIIIRGLATNEIKLKDFLKVLFKEFRVALIVGVVLAVANAARLWLLNAVYYHQPGGMVKEMIVVGIALIGTVVFAKTLGCVLPMLAKKLKLDPALLASPILTTLVDTGTVLLYFYTAILVL